MSKHSSIETPAESSNATVEDNCPEIEDHSNAASHKNVAELSKDNTRKEDNSVTR